MSEVLVHSSECGSASRSTSTLLVPDKDADGLTGTLIIYRTLVALGHSPGRLAVHFVRKGSNPHREEERQKLASYGAQYAVVVDQGSRPGPSLVPGTKTLLVDHHLSDDFPDDTLVSRVPGMRKISS
jgi:single-stranded DNA-specific DHH superfamily exonuclease